MATSRGCREFGITPGSGGLHPSEIGSICVTTRGSEIDASLTLQQFSSTGTPFKYDWKMSLQRYENGRWNTIGTRTGYVSRTSPSHRTFTNVARRGKPMRVWFHLYSPVNMGGSSLQWVNK